VDPKAGVVMGMSFWITLAIFVVLALCCYDHAKGGE
jgi:hypothetical protein